MKYPHWFCYIDCASIYVPFVVILASQAQAYSSVERYLTAKNILANVPPLIKFDSLESLLVCTGLAKSDPTFLTEDDRGKCLAFTYCCNDEKEERCNSVDYYKCKCPY